jgi:hypothetical protein
MNLKSSLLALAAVVALGTTALTSTADAKGFHGGGGKGFHGGGHFHKGGHGHFGHGHKHFGHGHFHRHHRHVHWHGHWRHRHIYYPRPVVYAARPVVYSAAPVVSTNRCTCLTKEYTPEGAVLFKDICTNEAAINPPPAPVQTGYAPQPTAPQAQ